MPQVMKVQALWVSLAGRRLHQPCGRGRAQTRGQYLESHAEILKANLKPQDTDQAPAHAHKESDEGGPEVSADCGYDGGVVGLEIPHACWYTEKPTTPKRTVVEPAGDVPEPSAPTAPPTEKSG